MQQSTQIGLNPTQLYLLNLFNYNRTENELQNLKRALTQFYAAELEKKKKEALQNGLLSEDKLQNFIHKHHRTPYK